MATTNTLTKLIGKITSMKNAKINSNMAIIQDTFCDSYAILKQTRVDIENCIRAGKIENMPEEFRAQCQFDSEQKLIFVGEVPNDLTPEQCLETLVETWFTYMAYNKIYKVHHKNLVARVNKEGKPVKGQFLINKGEENERLMVAYKQELNNERNKELARIRAKYAKQLENYKLNKSKEAKTKKAEQQKK